MTSRPPSWKRVFNTIQNLVFKDITIRYAGATLGFAWSLVNPVLITITFYTVFTWILPSKQENFALYLVVGIIHWNLFSQTISQSCEWLTGNAGIIQKIKFPRLTVAAAGMITNLIFWSVAFGVFSVLFVPLGGGLSAAILFYPVIICSYALFVFGSGLVMSILQVHFRDIKHIVDALLPLLFWFTPVVWPESIVPSHIRDWLYINPLLPFFNGIHDIFYNGSLPQAFDIALMLGLGISAVIIGTLVYTSQVDDLVERM